LGIVEMLQFYPESANLINIEIMDPKTYIAYLEFFIQDEESPLKDMIPKPIEHAFPHSIITKTSINRIVRII
jgi:hypothetical protein